MIRQLFQSAPGLRPNGGLQASRRFFCSAREPAFHGRMACTTYQRCRRHRVRPAAARPPAAGVPAGRRCDFEWSYSYSPSTQCTAAAQPPCQQEKEHGLRPRTQYPPGSFPASVTRPARLTRWLSSPLRARTECEALAGSRNTQPVPAHAPSSRPRPHHRMNRDQKLKPDTPTASAAAKRPALSAGPRKPFLTSGLVHPTHRASSGAPLFHHLCVLRRTEMDNMAGAEESKPPTLRFWDRRMTS